LLDPAPALHLDRITKGEAEARAAAIVGVEDVEALAHEKMDLAVDGIRAVRRWAAMHVDDSAQRVGTARPVEPALDLEAVHRAPVVVLGRGEVVWRERRALPHPRQADEAGRVRLYGVVPYHVGGLARARVAPRPEARSQWREWREVAG